MAIPILPGTAVKYVNAYLVTRHFGGREEGGWWYNWLRCVASVPVKASRHIGCIPGHCGECDDARERLDPNPASYCPEPHLIPVDPADVRIVVSSLSSARQESRLGVPPPKKMLETLRPQTNGKADSRSAIKAPT